MFWTDALALYAEQKQLQPNENTLLLLDGITYRVDITEFTTNTSNCRVIEITFLVVVQHLN